MSNEYVYCSTKHQNAFTTHIKEIIFRVAATLRGTNPAGHF